MCAFSFCKRFALTALIVLGLYQLAPSASAQVAGFSATNTIHFQTTNYFVPENGIQALVTVVRDGPLTNTDFVTIDYTMIDGTAVSGVNYFKQANTLFFPPGVDRAQFAIPVIDTYGASGDVFLTLILRNPGSGIATAAILGTPSTAILTIQTERSAATAGAAGTVEIAPGNASANGFGNFDSGLYSGTREEWNVDQDDNANFTPYGPAGIPITIVRKSGSRGRILVDWQTTTNITPLFSQIFFFDPFGGGFSFGGGLAIPNDDFVPTNGTVVLDDYQMATNVLIRLPAVILSTGQATNFLAIPTPATFGVELTGVRAAPEEAGLNVNPVLGSTVQQRIEIVDHSFGFAFTRLHYTVHEGQRFVRIRVRRSLSTDPMTPFAGVHVHYAVSPRGIVADPANGGDFKDNRFPLEPGSEYATPFIDFEPPGSEVWKATMAAQRAVNNPLADNDAEATLTWGDNDDTDKFIVIPLMDDNEAEFDEELTVVLWKHAGETDGVINFYAGSCIVKIVDNDQPAGASENDFDPDNNPLTNPPSNPVPGANATVQALAVQTDGKIILGGDFRSVNAQPRNHIARLNYDGSTDVNFNPGSGIAASGLVSALAYQPDGKIIVAGSFDSFNGTPRINIVRLLNNGSLDATFNPGSGTDGEIRALALQADGSILIGGNFTSVDGTNANYLARLTSSGRLDTSFNPGKGPDAPVNSIAISSPYGAIELDHSTQGAGAEDHLPIDTGSASGLITINYDFGTNANSLRVYYGAVGDPNRIAIFDSGLVSSNAIVSIPYPGAGALGQSTLIDIVIDEQNILGAPVTHAVWAYHVRIEPDMDARPVIGGEFTHVDGVPINYVARLNVDGPLDRTFDPGSGADDTVYAVAKHGNKVVLAGNFTQFDLRDRRRVAQLNEDGSLDTSFDPGTGFDNAVYSLAIQPSGRPVFGGPFRSFNQTRRIGLARLNLDGTLDTSFMDTAKNQFAGVPNPLSFENTESMANFIRAIAPYRITNLITITNFVVDTNNVTNIVLTTQPEFVDHLFVGGHFDRFGGGFLRDDNRVRKNIARLIGGETAGPGNISFVQDTYSVDENAGSTFITLVRTNGSLGPISSRFDTQDRSPAGPGVAVAEKDYSSATFFPLWIRRHPDARQYSDSYMGPNYNDFSTNREVGDFTVYGFPDRPPFQFRNFSQDDVFLNIIDNNVSDGDRAFNLVLTAPDEGSLTLGGQPIPVGAALGKAHATMTIVDDDYAAGTLGFAVSEYFVNENDGKATINLARLGGSAGTVTVDVYTQDLTATSTGATPDYKSVTKKTITFQTGQTNATFTVDVIDNSIAQLERSIRLSITNATGFPANVPAAQRLDPARSTATLWIIDNDFANGRISFSPSTYSVGESAGQALVNVQRRGGTLGDIVATYSTANGTARAGQNYGTTNGTLHWTDGDSSPRTITVPIFQTDAVKPDQTFSVLLNSSRINGTADIRGLGAVTNAVVTIRNEQSYGTFAFSQPIYNVDENGSFADIIVTRQNGHSGPVNVHFSATDLTAVGTTNATTTSVGENGIPDYVFPQYSPANGFTNVLQFSDGQTSAAFRVPVIDDSIVEGDKKVSLSLFSPGGGAQILSSNAVLVIIDKELNRIPAGQLDATFQAKGADSYIYALSLQSDGKILIGGDFHLVNDVTRNRVARLGDNGQLDLSFDPRVSPNDSVRALVPEPAGQVVLGGLFTSIGATNLFHIARLNGDASVDSTFDPGSGTDNPVYSIVEQPDGRIVIVGNFVTYRNVSRGYIARVNTNGVLDTTFNPGTGANAQIFAVALQSDGKILIGGDFTTFNGTPRAHLARLNRDGSLDNTFGGFAGFGTDASVSAIVVQSDGNILIGGPFTTVDSRPFNHIARLQYGGGSPGQIDDSFTLGLASDQLRAAGGANGTVSAIAVQLDGKILIGGDFTQFNGRSRGGLTRLNVDGSLDPSINFGSGANGRVSSIVVQPDRKILIAGGFTQYNGVSAQHIARIFGGAMSGGGQVRFTSPFFGATEGDANALVSISRTGGTAGPLSVDVLTTTNDTAIPGQDFTPVSTTVNFSEAETFRTVLIPLLRNTNSLDDRSISLVLTNVVGDGSIGSQPSARVTITNIDSQIEFSSAEYSINQSSVSGSAVITIRRIGSVVGPLSVDFNTIDGTAVGGIDYQPLNTTIIFAPGETSRTFTIPILDNPAIAGDKQLTLQLTNLVGNGVISLPTATLTIVASRFSPGQVEFTSDIYRGLKSSGSIVVTLRRVGGTTGVISVDYATTPGGDSPAQAPTDYIETSGQVSFGDGETIKSFTIPVVDNLTTTGNRTILVTLSNPKGGATITGPSQATAIIVDDHQPSGSLDRTFDPGSGANGEIRTVRVDGNNRIVIGGAFTVFNGANRSHLARLNSDAGVDATFDPGAGPDGTVADLSIDSDGHFTIGGQFNTVRGLFLNRVARLNPDSSPDTSFALPLGLNAEVSKVLRQPDGKVVIGGTFDVVDAAILNHIARLNADGTVDITFNPGGGTDGNVTALALQPDGKILVGGAFSRLDGVFKSGLVRLNPNGTVDTTFNGAGDGATGGGVQDILVLTNGQVVIAGNFTAYNDTPRARVARLNADGTLDTAFDPGTGPNRIVYAIASEPDGKLIIAGDFTSVGAASRNRIARLNQDGSHDNGFTPGNGANDAVLAVAVQPQDGRILIAGRFSQIDNEDRAGIARLNNDKTFITLQDVTFAPVVRSGDKLQFTVATQNGFSYTLESSTSVNGSWKPEQTTLAQGSTTVFEVSPTAGYQFFRIRRD